MDEFLQKYKEFNKIFKFKKIDLSQNKSNNNGNIKNNKNKTEYLLSPFYFLTNGGQSIIKPDCQADIPFYELLVEYPFLISNSLDVKTYGFYGKIGFETYKSVINKERINQDYSINPDFIEIDKVSKTIGLYSSYFIYSSLKDIPVLQKTIDLTNEGGHLVIETVDDVSANLDKIKGYFEYCDYVFSPVDLKIKVILLNRLKNKKTGTKKTNFIHAFNYYKMMVKTLVNLNNLGLEIHSSLSDKQKKWFDKQIKDIQFTNAMKIIQKYELPINPIYLSENEEETNVELNKFKNKLTFFFPKVLKIKGKTIKPDLSKIQISPESVYSITPYKEAVDTVYLISSFLKKPVDFLKNLVITDGTTNVGGNMIAFCQYFKYVNGVEIKAHHTDFLRNNLDLYGFDNYKIIHGDITKEFEVLKQDLLFLDPPWGGVLYKYYPEIGLYLSGMEVADLIAKLSSETKYVGLKVPFNYKISNIQQKVDYKRMVVYNLKRYLIVMIERN